MNLPNLLTISRVPLMFIVVGLMYADFHWAATLAFWLYIAAALTDWLDGKIARERGEVSAFGRFMDAVIDKVLVIGLMIALVNGDYFLGYNIGAMMLLLCILCREFAISGLRMAAAVKGEVVEADIFNARSLAALMQGCDAVINLVGALQSRPGDPWGPQFARAHVELPRMRPPPLRQHVPLLRCGKLAAFGMIAIKFRL